MIEFTQAEVARYYACRVPKLKQRGTEWRGPCPVHGGSRDSFAVSPTTGQAHCHSACGRGWDVLGLEQQLTGSDFQKAKEEVFSITGKIEPQPDRRKRGTFDCAYDYLDADGKLVYQAIRFREPKGFTQRRPDGQGDWIWNLSGVTRIPYRLPELLKSDFAFVVEGEKDADNIAALGVVATCNSQGAGKFGDELVPHFAGKSVAILPDNDSVGREHAYDVARKLHGTAKSIKVVEIPNLPDKGDVSDYLASGGTLDGLRKLYREAPQWTPETAPHPEDVHVSCLREEIDAAGGLGAFWDLRRVSGIPTPYEKLTKALGGGFRAGEVYVVAARTGAGKTSFALQCVKKAMRSIHAPFMFSMEMNRAVAFQRMIAAEALVDLNEYQWAQEQKQDTTQERLALVKATSEFIDKPFWISTKARVTPSYVIGETRRMKERHPEIDLVVVDHMQLMSADAKVRSDYEKFTEISRTMKQVAMELNVPLLLVAQISRQDDYTELEMDDIRGSGAIEEDAAGVIMIYHDKEDAQQAKAMNRYEKGPVKTWLKLAKARFGSSGLYLPLLHQKCYTRFDLMETNV